jgi:hypothetical protein
MQHAGYDGMVVLHHNDDQPYVAVAYNPSSVNILPDKWLIPNTGIRSYGGETFPPYSQQAFAKTAAHYHVAPTSERDRILTHGLQPADPKLNWPSFDNAPPEDLPPTGVYMFNDRDRADTYRTTLEFRRGQPHDVWNVVLPRQPIQDPDLSGSSKYLGVPVDPSLLRLEEGPEHRERMPEYMRPQYVQPTDPWQRGPWPLSQGEGQGNLYPQNDPEAWDMKVGGVLDYYYHVSPRNNRDRIQAHGLHPTQSMWENYPPERLDDPTNLIKNPPSTGIYFSRSPQGAKKWTEFGLAAGAPFEGSDIWRVPRTAIQEMHPDPHVRGAFYVTRPVPQAELYQPAETQENNAWHEHINYPENEDRPNYYPDQEKEPVFGWGWEGTKAIKDNPQWGIGKPDRVWG